MKQVILYKNGTLCLEEVPAPILNGTGVIVRSEWSAISPGTEMASIRDAGENIFVKLYKRGKLLNAIKKRLNFQYFKKYISSRGMPEIVNTVPSPMGYSSAGTVIETNCSIEVGQKVVCMGAGHAEYMYVPKNLCAPLPVEVDPKEAAFGALGCIAMHGVRRADVQFGQIIVVMGLGIIGQITCQYLKNAGCTVIAIDLNNARLKLSKELGADFAVNAIENDIIKEVFFITKGFGADAVLICAASSSAVPMQHAMEMARSKGKVVVVGDVKLEVPRKPFYTKEVDLLISTSYGPGRYDPLFEQKGFSYPLNYVRWTETENLKEYISLLQNKKISINKLITKSVQFYDIVSAYNEMNQQQANMLAVALEYDSDQSSELERRIEMPNINQKSDKINTAVIGCGGFAQNFHLPNLFKNPKYKLTAVAELDGVVAKSIANRYNANYCTTDYEQVIKDPDIDLIVITTRHNQHAPMLLKSLENGKHVFVEKPIAMTVEECRQINETAKKNAELKIGVGFNRRFSELATEVYKFLAEVNRPIIINYRVASMPIPQNHWINDPVEGGGRILGESVHFVDFMCWLAKSEPLKVLANGKTFPIHDTAYSNENYMMNITFKNGSMANLIQTDMSTTDFPKERIEIFIGGTVIVIDNFENLTIKSNTINKVINKQDKGFYAELDDFADAITKKLNPSISHKDGIRATACALAAVDSINSGKTISIDNSIYE